MEAISADDEYSHHIQVQYTSSNQKDKGSV